MIIPPYKFDVSAKQTENPATAYNLEFTHSHLQPEIYQGQLLRSRRNNFSEFYPHLWCRESWEIVSSGLGIDGFYREPPRPFGTAGTLASTPPKAVLFSLSTNFSGTTAAMAAELDEANIFAALAEFISSGFDFNCEIPLNFGLPINGFEEHEIDIGFPGTDHSRLVRTDNSERYKGGICLFLVRLREDLFGWPYLTFHDAAHPEDGHVLNTEIIQAEMEIARLANARFKRVRWVVFSGGVGETYPISYLDSSLLPALRAAVPAGVDIQIRDAWPLTFTTANQITVLAQEIRDFFEI